MATSGDLQLALLIKANAQQARAELAATQAQLKGVEASAKQAGTGFGAYNASLNDITAAQRTAAAAAGETTDALAATSQAFTTTAAATAATGETAEQAAARIHAMVQASLAAQDAALGRSAAEAAAAKTARGTADAAAAQSRSWRDVTAAQTAAMNSYHAARAPYEAVQQVLEKSTITTAEFDAASLALAKAVGTGAITAGEYREALDLLDAAKIKDVAVTKAQTAANKEQIASGLKVNSRLGYSLSALISDAASGQVGRSKRELSALANESGLISKLLTPTGAAIGGVVAALAALGVAYVKGEAEVAKFNAALISTGGYAGVTAKDLHDMAGSISGATFGQAKQALLALAQSGRFTGQQLTRAAQAAVDMSRLTGQSMESAIKSITALQDDPVHAIEKLNEQFHFLDTATLQQIQRLQDLGQTQQATDLAESTYADHLRSRAQDMESQIGTLQRVWDSLKSSASFAWDAMMGIGRNYTGAAATSASYDALLQRRQALLDIANGGMGLKQGVIEMAKYPDILGMSRKQMLDEATSLDHSLELLRGQMSKDRSAASDKAESEKLKDAGNKAALAIHDAMKGFDKSVDHAQAVAKVTAQLSAIVSANGVLPEGVQQLGQKFFGPGFDYLVDKAAGISTKGIPGAQLHAALAAAQTAVKQVGDIYANGQKVIEAQHKAGLVNDQAYYDAERGMLDVWERDKTTALEKEKQAAQSHIVTQADRIRADQKVAEIDGEIAQVHADAQAKRLALNAQEKKSLDTLRAAWEKLQAIADKKTGSVDFGAFDKQIATAKAALGAGLTDQKGYQDTIDKLIMEAVQGTSGAPKYRGVSARVGGAFADYGRAQSAENAENVYFQQELNRLVAFFNQKKITSEKYYADLEQLAQAHSQRLEQIDQAKDLAMLAGLTSSFDQAASAVRSAFGAQSTAYRVAFDIAKTAAIAQSTLAMFQAVAEASKMPWPANLGLMAEAFAQGMSIVADIRAIQLGPSGGYAEGGYTGTGGKHQVAGLVHAGEVVYSQADVARHGGVAAVEAHRLRGYADGGFVSPLANAPSPAELGFTMPASPRMDFAKLAAANDSAAAARAPNVKVVAVWDRDQAAHEVLNTPTGHKVIVQTVGDNPRTIQGKWQTG